MPIDKHFLQFIDPAGVIHEVQVPPALEGVVGAIIPFGDRHVMKYYAADGTQPMIAMPEGYGPDKGWQFGGYRREPG